jgi:hypothetical protein
LRPAYQLAAGCTPDRQAGADRPESLHRQGWEPGQIDGTVVDNGDVTLPNYVGCHTFYVSAWTPSALAS